MPFTVSHAAAVLPLQRFGKRTLPLSALMVGSMAPDFGYFFWHEASRQLTHSFLSVVLFSLPMGLLVWVFYVLVLEKATITLLPDRWHTRFARTPAITLSLAVRAAVAIMLGAVTHIIWDAFTHRATFATDAFPALLGSTPGFSWLPIYHLLHGISSVVGLVILSVWARRLHRQPAKALIRPYEITEKTRNAANGFLAVAAVLGGLVDWLPYQYTHYSAQLFYLAVGLMSGFFIAWCAVAVGLWVYDRKRNRRH